LRVRGLAVDCRIEQLVREDVPSLEEGTSVAQAARLMATHRVGSCVVIREGRIVGLFTERDLLTRVVAEGREPSAVSLSEVCSRDLVSANHDITCRQAVAKMQSHLCQRLLVYRQKQFMGLVKLADLAYALASRGRQTDMLVSTIGGVTLAVAVGVIIMLLIQLPDLLSFLGQTRAP
jgi:signal-transduction protein with cAMP-binding, CBS, and nucleotidyltransferase domain